jgi:hypothetical protein
MLNINIIWEITCFLKLLTRQSILRHFHFLDLSIKHILPSIQLLIRTHERYTTTLHVQVFLRMNSWMFETCRRLTYLLSYLLTTPWSRVLLEKLTGLQLVKKMQAFYGTRRFITAFTPTVSILSQLHPAYTPTSYSLKIHLSFCHLRLGLPSGLFPLSFPTKTLHTPLPSPSDLHTPPIPFFSILSPAQLWVRSAYHGDLHFQVFFRSPVTSSLLGPNILLNTLHSNTLNLRSSLNVSDQVSHPYKTTGKSN